MTVTITLPPAPSQVPDFKADGETVLATGKRLQTDSSVFDDHGSFAGGKAKDCGLLDGRAAEAYTGSIAPIAKHADALSLALRSVAKHVIAHGEDLTELETRHRRLVEDHDELVREVDALTARTRPMPTDQAQLDQLSDDCHRCTDHVLGYESDVERWAEDLRASEQDLLGALRGAMTESQVDRAWSGKADPADAARASMPDGSDPKAVKAWWDDLSPDERQAMIAAYPEVVGNTDGVPAGVRSEANTISLDRDLAQLAAIPEDQRTDDEQTRYENAQAADRARDQINQSKDPLTGESYAAQIYMYDPMAFDGDGAVAMAVGDLDTADNVAVTVPGLTTDMGSARGNAESAVNLQQAAAFEGGTSNATMFWIGYDAPDNHIFGEEGTDIVGVVSEDMATAGGERYADTLDGLNAMRSDDFHLTAVGHSYGSTTVSHAMTDHHPAADDVVLLGSPGVGGGTTSDDELGVGDGHVWVGKNSNDPVARLGDEGWVDMWLAGGGGLGRNPAEDDFGANRFEAESTTRGETGFIGDHNKYYDHDTESLANIARIVNGQYDDVDRADPVHDPFLGGVEDPEEDRTPTAPDTDGRP
ncbi:MAG: alpha/beta hydrolase [Nocardioides sp.]|uniref:alpha/beta hydrolase n=1 Tax=Nocardioides sp. TaxID=35761 RepID=UPI003D6A5D14